jgi:hypothetical protein
MYCVHSPFTYRSAQRERAAATWARLTRVCKPFRCQNHVVLLSQPHTKLAPCIEVLARRDRATDPLLLAHTPVLREGRRADDGRLVDALRGEDVVGAFAVNGDVAFLGPGLAGCEDVVGLDNVVLD